MIDRYTITQTSQEMKEKLGLNIPVDYYPRFNAAPTQQLPVITMNEPDQIQMFRWGFMSNLANNRQLSPKLFNLVFNQAVTKPSHKKSLESKRCVVLADGFYLWKQIAKKRQTPYYIHSADHSILYMAALWEENETLEGDVFNSFILLTVPALDNLAEYQEDAPLILNQETKKDWLAPSMSMQEITSLKTNSPDLPLNVHPVGPNISNIEADHEDLIKPSKPLDQFGNYTLFG
jgi:putative SOS response-associated peptidase YedK